MKSQFVFRAHKSGFQIPAPDYASISTSSDGAGWKGLRLEVGTSRGMRLDDVMVDGHLVAFNLTDAKWQFEARGESDWFSACMPPQAFWINPEGCPFSVRHAVNTSWASVTVDGKYLDSIAGHHYELRQEIGVGDDLLAHLMRSLVANLYDREAASKIVDEELIRSFVLALAKRHGYPAAELSVKGGIAPHQLKTLLSWLDEHIEEPLTIDVLASQLRLSAAHFSREFKRSTGFTPWGYVVQLRLDRARDLIREGECLSTVASRCGFSDQSHMSRLFKQRFGASPSSFVKEAGLMNP